MDFLSLCWVQRQRPEIFCLFGKNLDADFLRGPLIVVYSEAILEIFGCGDGRLRKCIPKDYYVGDAVERIGADVVRFVVQSDYILPLTENPDEIRVEVDYCCAYAVESPVLERDATVTAHPVNYRGQKIAC